MEVDDFPSSKYSKLNSNNAKQRLQPSKIGFITTGTGDGGGGPTTVTATAATTAAMAAALNGGGGGGGGGGDVLGASTRFGRQWQHSSRIIRVSRASGGKDRHSKVWTAKGPRDRRVRLSVNTAIQFYDLQDRLGYDQPSKAVEWLIKAAADSINELPSLSNINFPPDTPRSGGNINNNNNCVIESGGAELLQQDQQQQQLQQVGSMSMSKSGCSSNNSETSKGSGLSLSRSEIRVKARERARERTAKEKDENLSSAARVTVAAAAAAAHNDNVSSMGQTSSFTQLLTAGINNLKDCTPTPSPHSSEQRAGRNMAVFCDTTTTTTPPMVDYCGTTTTGFMGLSSTHSHLGNGPLPHVMTLLPYSGSHEIQHQHQHQHQQLPFFLDHHHPLIQIPNNHNNTPNNAATGGGGGGGGGDYNLNFSISSASTTSGFNRGTLQSNSSSPSFLSYLQRFSATDGGGGSSVPFFLGGAPISPIVDNQHYHHHHHHHDNHQQQYNSGGLHLNYGEGPPRHSDDKGKGKH